MIPVKGMATGEGYWRRPGIPPSALEDRAEGGTAARTFSSGSEGKLPAAPLAGSSIVGVPLALAVRGSSRVVIDELSFISSGSRRISGIRCWPLLQPGPTLSTSRFAGRALPPNRTEKSGDWSAVARTNHVGQVPAFDMYAIEWIDSRVDLAERTVELYQWLFHRHLEPTFAGRPIPEIGPAEIRAWHARAAREHPTTAVVHPAYRGRRRAHRRNPCQVRGVAVERAPERPIATIAEVNALSAAMPPELQISVLLATWCQLRRGEVRGLRRIDIDLSFCTLSITMTKTTPMSGRTIFKEPKTRAGRGIVAIPPHIVDPLAIHLDRYVDGAPDSCVLEASDRALGNAWRQARASLGREDLRFYDLRHSGLTWAAATGASIAELMRRAGPASQAAALRYQHATDDRDRVLAQALAKLTDQAGSGA